MPWGSTVMKVVNDSKIMTNLEDIKSVFIGLLEVLLQSVVNNNFERCFEV